MSEIANFVRHGSAKITSRSIKSMLKQLPLLKAEFTQVSAPAYPHLVDQLEFLADVVEDYAEGTLDEMPLLAIAGAAFAITYAHRQMDLIPDFVSNRGADGHADDSAIVRAVLIEHEAAFGNYANKRGIEWSSITIKA